MSRVILSDPEDDYSAQHVVATTTTCRPQKRKHTEVSNNDEGPADGVYIHVRNNKKRSGTLSEFLGSSAYY